MSLCCPESAGTTKLSPNIMSKLRLTDPFIRHHPAPNKRIEIYDENTPGLALRITKTGHKSFVYRYRFNDKVKRYTIGSYSKMSLKEARNEAGELAYKVNHGIDPMEEKKERKKRPEPKKFEYLVEQYKKRHFPKLRSSTQKTYGERIDGEMMPAFKGMAIKDITRTEILDLLEEIAYDRGKTTHSNRVRAILSSMFSFAVQKEIAEYNPVKSIKPLGKENKRDRVLTEQEIKKLWEGFHTMLTPTGSLLKILLLLGQRKGETSRMEWDHIKDGIWTIPKEQTKADRKHFVPLPPLALEIIERLENDSPYVFESYRNEGEPIKWINAGFNRLAESLNISDIKIHDLRRTAATYMAELGTDRTILGKVLNHKGLAGDSQVTARYDRYSYMEEKQTALNRWSHKLQQIIEGKESKIHKIA